MHYSKPEGPPKMEGIWCDIREIKKHAWKRELPVSKEECQTHIQFSQNARKKEIKIIGLAFDSTLSNSESMRRAKNLVKMLEVRAKATGFTSIVTDRTIINPEMAKKMGYSLVKKMRPVSVGGTGKYATYRYSKAIKQE